MTAWRGHAAAIGLFVLAPISAEYMAAYDDSTGDPAALLAGLLFFGPLYGGAALLIRECARRFGLDWPAIMLFSVAFGLVQAGLVDQSLFSTDYRGIDYWDEITAPTLVPPLGISGYTATNFVAGHAIWSVCVPVALVEAIASGRRAQPWLGHAATGAVALVYLGASALVLLSHLETEGAVVSPGRLIGTSVVATALIVAAFATRLRRRGPARITAAPPPPIVLGSVAFLLALIHLWDAGWVSVAVSLLVLAGFVAAVSVWSRSQRWWSGRHAPALAAGAMLALAVQGFLATPLGDVSPGAKYGHNIAMALVALSVTTLAVLRTDRAGRPGTTARPPEPEPTR